MPSYDALHFEPPAPTAQLILRDPRGGATVSDVLLLLDTGADATLLPRAAVERLGVSPLVDERYELIGFDGSKSFAPAALLEIIFLGRAFRGRYLLIEQDLGVLGRDVLNHLTLLLDGPRQKWSEPSLP
jgi:predicted aspartyl protease